MRTSFILSLMTLLMNGTAMSQFENFKPSITLESKNLLGAVSRIETKVYTISKFKGFPTDTSFWFGNIHEFDLNGNCTKHADIESNEEEGDKELYSYNEHEFITEKVEYNDKGKLDSRITNEFTFYGSGDLRSINTKEYDSSNILVYEKEIRVEYIEEGKTRCETYYLLPKQDYYKTDVYYPNGTPTDYRYTRRGFLDDFNRDVFRKVNRDNLLIEESYRKADTDTVLKVYYFSYDQKKQLIEKKEVHEAYPDLNCTYIYEYDDRGNKVLETTYDHKGKFRVQYKNSYDEYNNLTRTTHMKRRKKVDFEVVYDYTYDDQGNWITKHKYAIGAKIGETITRRSISYR